MTGNYYDAVVLGMEIGPLAAGALLARRGFRVLVVGQSGPRERYGCLGFVFARRPFLLTAGESPVIARVIEELTLGQLFHRVLSTPSPAYQVVLPRARLDMDQDPERVRAEIKREVPAAAQSVDVMLRGLGRYSGEIDKLLANDIVVPPETFFERRDFSRAEVQNPFRSVRDRDVFAAVEGGAALEEVLGVTARLEAGGADPLPPIVLVRQIAGWLFGCRIVREGRDGLRGLLGDRIVGQGGDVHPDLRATEIVVDKKRVVGVRIAGREDLTGCQIALTDLGPGELSSLIAPTSWPKRFKDMIEEERAPVLGYSLNLGVNREVMPAGLEHTCIVRSGPGLGDELVRVEVIPQTDEDKAAVNVSCVVPPGEEEKIATGELRDALLDRMRWLIPFLDGHLRVIHSPFDGFGALDLTGRERGETPRVPPPEEIPRWLVRRPPGNGALGFEGLPHRTGIKGLILSGGQVVCGLGAEGDLLAAWGAARIAGRMDPGRERLVRSMRSKVEA